MACGKLAAIVMLALCATAAARAGTRCNPDMEQMVLLETGEINDCSSSRRALADAVDDMVASNKTDLCAADEAKAHHKYHQAKEEALEMVRLPQRVAGKTARATFRVTPPPPPHTRARAHTAPKMSAPRGPRDQQPEVLGPGVQTREQHGKFCLELRRQGQAPGSGLSRPL